MKIFHLGLYLNYIEIEQSNTVQTMQTRNLQQVSHHSGLDLEIYYMLDWQPI